MKRKHRKVIHWTEQLRTPGGIQKYLGGVNMRLLVGWEFRSWCPWGPVLTTSWTIVASTTAHISHLNSEINDEYNIKQIYETFTKAHTHSFHLNMKYKNIICSLPRFPIQFQQYKFLTFTKNINCNKAKLSSNFQLKVKWK